MGQTYTCNTKYITVHVRLIWYSWPSKLWHDVHIRFCVSCYIHFGLMLYFYFWRYTCMHAFERRIHVYIYMCVCMYIYICIHIYIYICIYIHSHIYVCIYMRVYVHFSLLTDQCICQTECSFRSTFLMTGSDVNTPKRNLNPNHNPSILKHDNPKPWRRDWHFGKWNMQGGAG